MREGSEVRVESGPEDVFIRPTRYFILGVRLVR